MLLAMAANLEKATQKDAHFFNWKLEIGNSSRY